MGKCSCCSEIELKKGPWTAEEDQKLSDYVHQFGHGTWRSLPHKAGLQRCGKSCRLRWINYLRPDIKRGNFSFHEQQTIIQLHALLGNRWSVIASHLPKRTDSEIKNYWNTHLKKRLVMRGINPETHKPVAATFGSNASNLRHLAEWESVRLEAEARLVRQSMQLQNLVSGSPATAAGPLMNRMASRLAPPRCLDILKAWQNVMSVSSTDNNGCKMLKSPTSILKFPEAAAMENLVQQQQIGLSYGGDSWSKDEVGFPSLSSNNITSDHQAIITWTNTEQGNNKMSYWEEELDWVDFVG